jgi:acetyl-CoA carboxylase biotin carboxyl carrier protein
MGKKSTSSERGMAVKIDLDQIRNLLAVVSQTDITELTIESGDEKITVKKAGTTQVVAANSGGNHVEVPSASTVPVLPKLAPVAATAAAAAPPPQPAAAGNNQEQSNNGLVPITSPMVGTFYSAPSPTSPAFVQVGDNISVGQTVCIIEAMKLMNDLPAEVSGKVVKILVENGTTVEFGQPLMMVDPRG